MYINIEIQTDTSGRVATIVNAYEDRPSAESAYHNILAAAAVSALPKHAAVMVDETGLLLRSECYTHEAAE